MYRVALNVAISFYRRERKHKDHDEFSERLIVYEDDPGEKESNLKLLQGFIHELKEIDKAIILLYLEDKGHREIAEITGFTETNVSTRISRIKETLRVKFQNQ
jgi:RNA polymerase sigma-70 factor (ECF subfamily)